MPTDFYFGRRAGESSVSNSPSGSAKARFRVRYSLIGVKLLAELLFRDKAACLAEDGYESTRVQFAMPRNGERLDNTSGCSPAELGVASPL